MKETIKKFTEEEMKIIKEELSVIKFNWEKINNFDDINRELKNIIYKTKTKITVFIMIIFTLNVFITKDFNTLAILGIISIGVLIYSANTLDKLSNYSNSKIEEITKKIERKRKYSMIK